MLVFLPFLSCIEQNRGEKMRNILAAEYPVIEEARKTGRGNSFFLELIKSTIVLFIMICITGVISDLLCAFIPENVAYEPWDSIVVLYSEIFSVAIGILYCTVFEQRSLRSVGFSHPICKPYGIGALIGILAVSLVVLISTICRGLRFSYINTRVSIPIQILLLGGFIIQGLSEEVLCRGYIFVSIARKSSVSLACLGSSVLFCLIHIFNDGFSFIPMLNLVLFGILESLLFLKTNNIWAAGAFHSVWNYVQGCVYGLNVSGNGFTDSIVVFEQTDKKFVNGGIFGPEGSIITTIVLLVAMAVLVVIMNQETAK